jgi:hypothetical protein
MPLTDRALRRAALVALAAVALGGYLIGHNALSSSGHARAMKSAIVANVLVEYPREWQRAPSSPLASLALSEAAVLAPGGQAEVAGLVIGSLPAGERGPLPRGFLRSLTRPPQTAIVNLSVLQAYRYVGADVATLSGPLTVYAIPLPGGRTTIAACYAQQGAEAFVGRCSRVVAGLTELGPSQSYNLAPELAYARGLAAAIGEVDAGRSQIAGTPAGATTPADIQRLAAELAARFARAKAGLAALEPAAAAQRAHSALLHALAKAAAAYRALALAESIEVPAEVTIARARVRSAEAAVDEGLEGLSLLGYGSAPGASAGAGG